MSPSKLKVSKICHLDLEDGGTHFLREFKHDEDEEFRDDLARFGNFCLTSISFVFSDN